jgi:quinol monooxygenase YgiN
MYGTIARIRIKKDAEGKLREVMDAMESRPVAGFIASYVYRLDGDPQDLMLAVVFADRDTYHRNANDPAQDVQFRELRQLLERDPEWNDGEIIWSWPKS